MTRKFGIWVGLAAMTLAGCGDSGSAKTTDTPVADKAGDEDIVAAPNAPATDPTKKVTGNLEVQAFKGGFDIDLYKSFADQFAKDNPGLKVTVDGDPRVWEKLRPRMVAENTPDLMFPGWGMDHWAMVDEGQVMALDQALDSPAFGGKGTWRDSFEPSLLKLGQLNGKQYVLPYYFNVLGWWYDPGVFAKNGWTVPKTFDELLTLCDKIKAKGIAPITFQGKYPYYTLQGMVLPWAQSVGGITVLNDIDNLKPGAWKSPAVLKAIQMLGELRDKDDFEKGAVGLSHTESQTDFLSGKAAMIPCGTWLETEMHKQMPAGAKMKFMLPPVDAKGTGDPTAIQISIEPWMVPAKAKNPEAAVALFKYMTSLDKAKEFVKTKGTLMAIKGSDDVKLPDSVPAAEFHASKTVYAYHAREWYPALETEVENALTAFLNKEITPEQFCDRAEAAAEKVRKDDSVPKRKLD